MLRRLQDKSISELEEAVLEYWKKHRIFEKSVEQRKRAKFFSFFDGPPFLSGSPHYGHILATAIKDTVTRFWTMKGYRVERRVGWDCHGLPAERFVEEQLGIKDKREIEKMGIDQFNKACRESGLACVGDFKKTLQRAGRWADYEHAYFTWDNDYMESVWWVFSQLWKAGAVYRDYAIAPYCPRCGTPLSNFEVNQGYKDVEDPSIFIKFEIRNTKSETNSKHSKSKFKTKNSKLTTKSYFLVWTTTPWTLPGNVALAVNPTSTYVEVEISEKGKENSTKEYLILAKERLPVISEPYRIIREFKGKALLGMSYAPLFRGMVEDENLAAISFKVYEGDFVSMEDGTGIVHIAPAFGEDDYRLIKSQFTKSPPVPRLRRAGKSQKNSQFKTGITVGEFGKMLPIPVDEEGKMMHGLPGQGKFVKQADPLLIDDLTKRNLLYREERVSHSYPFCWRCDTPLLYYPVESWYVAVSTLRKQLVANNKKIRWVPAHLKEGRFGNWLKDARDWVISRNRFWGAPLPIWQCDKGHVRVFGSLLELSDAVTSSGNRYFLLRHGEADHTLLGIHSSWPEKSEIHLTARGRTQVEKTIPRLKKANIDMIFSSDLTRTKETAKIVGDALGVRIVYEKRLREYDLGVFNGRPIEEFSSFFGSPHAKFNRVPEGGESLYHVRQRTMHFVREFEKHHRHKNILLISHGDPLWVLEGAARGLDEEGIMDERRNSYIGVGELREIEFKRLPYTLDGAVDLHRPYIDELDVRCQECNGAMRRIPQVFDCWFESGSMPYAQWHYPFENKTLVEKTFPADFIAEGLDQTRGWFYTLHVLATALTMKNIGFGTHQPAFKNVVVNGQVLAEDGKKLSKRLKNYTAPEIAFQRYGADAVRYFLLASSPIGEDYRFSDSAVLEMKHKVVDRLLNSYRFFALYTNAVVCSAPRSPHVLDRWILARLSLVVSETTKAFEAYELTTAARALAAFLDDLSNWYIRRSRRRLQHPDSASDYRAASHTLSYVLYETVKLCAPFLPFSSEAVYTSLRSQIPNPKSQNPSVHLEDWPKVRAKKLDTALLDGMEEVRRLASLALAQRAEAGIKVRQPLAALKIRNAKSEIRNSKELLKILADEVNVKEVVFDEKLTQELELDTHITPALRNEGRLRDIIRLVQSLRQEAELRPQDEVAISFGGSSELISLLEAHEDDLKTAVGAREVHFSPAQVFDVKIETKVDGEALWIGVRKL